MNGIEITGAVHGQAAENTTNDNGLVGFSAERFMSVVKNNTSEGNAHFGITATYAFPVLPTGNNVANNGVDYTYDPSELGIHWGVVVKSHPVEGPIDDIFDIDSNYVLISGEDRNGDGILDAINYP